MTAAAEGAQAGQDRCVFERNQSPWLELVEHHGRIAGDHDGSIAALGFDEVAQAQADLIELAIDGMVGAMQGV